jgi:putative membrane protein
VRWGAILAGAVGLLASLALGLAVAELVAALFAAQGWLGWAALGLAAVAAIAVAAILVREVFGLLRLGRLRAIRAAAGAAELTDAEARRLAADLARLYAGRPELAAPRRELSALAVDVIDPADRIGIAERALMAPLDGEARRLVADAAKRISVVTAVSPSALVDLGFVLVTHVVLVRRLAELYGGRPGFLGLVRLVRLVVAQLAVTGGIALGDDIVQQLVGHGLAARLSARLGEGVLNGLFAARIGIAAIEVCRPLPFVALKRPRVTDFATAMRPRQPQVPDG